MTKLKTTITRLKNTDSNDPDSYGTPAAPCRHAINGPCRVVVPHTFTTGNQTRQALLSKSISHPNHASSLVKIELYY